jgi:hypothetical protein
VIRADFAQAKTERNGELNRPPSKERKKEELY